MKTDWHHRYKQQARWTQDLRAYLYSQANIQSGFQVLDLGCGTGVVMKEIIDLNLKGYGLDIDRNALDLAERENSGATFTQGDGHFLPYENNSFDLAICHFVLMWLVKPIRAIAEMARVTKPGGKVMAFAEPDYGGRIDYPDELRVIGQLQIESLERQGADPTIGRQLPKIFNQAGLLDVESGVLGGQWSGKTNWNSWELEWQVFEDDVAALSGRNLDLAGLKNAEITAHQNGHRMLFVPTFYAWGVVK